MKSIILVLLVVQSNILIGQSNLNLKKYLENTPSSPNATALTKYAGGGVSLNTGTVTYGVPIYQIKAWGIDLPVSLKYASNGIRVNESPSLTGMGWTLEAGGVITRQRNGGVDEYGQRVTLPDNINVCSQEFFNFFHYNSNPTLQDASDTEPDMFSFNFAGYSGKFVLDANKQPFLLPKSNLTIESVFNNSSYHFKITTPDGLKYYFGGDDATEETLLNSANRVCTYNNSGNDIPIKTAFYLNKIVTPAGDSIMLDYDIYCFEQWPTIFIQVCNHPVDVSLCNGTSACPSSRESFFSNAFYRYRILKKIIIPGLGRIDFNYTGYNTEGAFNSYKEYKTLTNIQVFNNQQRRLKNINLGYNYVQTTIGAGTQAVVIPPKSIRPFLTAVSDGPESYSFEYENPQGLPVFGALQQDLWGYFNGQPNTSFIPNVGINQVECPEASANRNVYPEYIKYGMLKQITSPTGGYDLITYEGNSTIHGLVSGLRVQKIVTYDNSTGQSLTKKYYYAALDNLTQTSGYGVIPVVQDERTSGYVCPPNPPYYTSLLATCRYQVTTSQPINDLNIYGGNIVSYKFVTESIGGENFENGAIEHEFRVENYNYAYPVMNASLFDAPLNFDKVLNGVESKTKIHKKSSTGPPFILLEQKENFYSLDNSSINDKVIGWKSYLKWEYDWGVDCNYPEVEVSKTYYYRFWPHLDRTVTTVWDENGSNPLTTEEKYYYTNLQHLQLTKTEKYDSKGTLAETTFKYPHDFSATGNVYENMVNRNIISPAIETKSTKGSKSFTVKSNYSFDWFADKHIVLPVNIEAYKNLNPPESRVRYHGYDTYGNFLELSKENDLHTSYLWDYNHSLISAEVKNASKDQIAYTSFEADSKGNWNYSGVPFLDNTAPTGKRVYNLNATSNVSKSGLIGTTTYIISYWTQNSSAFSIVGTQQGYPIQSKVIGSWKLFEHKITGQTSITISGVGIIDELRLYPSNAQMWTYIYEPMLGMIAQCDLNNRITYYEYDEYGRLVLTRDEYKNILKKDCYNYYWQTGSCDIFYNGLQSGVFYKECTSGYTGSAVTYTVPAGVYISTIGVPEANEMAINDVLANGLAYANALGTCTPTPNCNTSNCTGVDKKCINGVCQIGTKIYTSSVQIGSHLWECTYHYEWSNGSWSQNYIEQSAWPCYNIY